MAKKPVALKLPKTMGACADLLYEIKNQRSLAQKVVDDLQAQESLVREHIINNLPKSDTGASGKMARVSVTTKIVPRIDDWTKFYAHVKKTGEFELLQKRLSDAAVKERWDNKKKVPGVGEFQAVVVNLNKI